MSKSSWIAVLILGTAGATFTGRTMAETIEVGSGTNTANLYLEFKDGAIFDFAVYFDGTISGLGLFDVIESQTTLTTIRENYGFGIFVDGISYEGHTNSGYDGGEDWWHYWVMDGPTESWVSPIYGVADRVISDGFSDGWIYGRVGAPVPEPAAMALLTCGLLMLKRRRS